MKTIRNAVVLFALAGLALLASAEGVLDGTWRSDPKRVTFSKKPSVQRIAGGKYVCASCTPRIEVPADGADHPVAGHAFDTAAAKVVDDRTVEFTYKKDGKVLNTVRLSVSADGKTYTREAISTFPSGQVASSSSTWRRVSANGGDHAVSGSWLGVKVDSESEMGSTFTLKTSADLLHMTTPEGISYSAPLDGSSAPVTGDPGTTAVKVKKLGLRGFAETSYRDDKPYLLTRMVVAPDGKTARVTWTNLKSKATGSYTVVRQ